MTTNKTFWLLPAIALVASPALHPGYAETGSSFMRATVSRPAAAGNGSVQAKAFARVLSGGGWQTTIALLDLGPTPVSFHESFVGNDGNPCAVTVRLQSGGELTTSALQGTIGPNGTVNFTLPDNGSPLQETWSLLTFDGMANQVGGYATLRHSASNGAFDFEVTLPLKDMQDFSAHMPFDNTGGFQTQLTLVNPAANLPAQVQLTYFDEHGQVILLDSIELKPGAQITLALPNTYPDLANQSGTIGIFANINCLAATGLRYNPASGAIFGIPVMDFSLSINLQ